MDLARFGLDGERKAGERRGLQHRAEKWTLVFGTSDAKTRA
jgi:hypothetical protein